MFKNFWKSIFFKLCTSRQMFIFLNVYMTNNGSYFESIRIFTHRPKLRGGAKKA